MESLNNLILEGKNNISVKDTAELLGVSQPYIREGLKSGRLPFGSAVQINGTNWTFHISPLALKEYITGSTNLKTFFQENIESLKKILKEGE